MLLVCCSSSHHWSQSTDKSSIHSTERHKTVESRRVGGVNWIVNNSRVLRTKNLKTGHVQYIWRQVEEDLCFASCTEPATVDYRLTQGVGRWQNVQIRAYCRRLNSNRPTLRNSIVLSGRVGRLVWIEHNTKRSTSFIALHTVAAANGKANFTDSI